MKFKTKGISLLLSIAMLLSMFPATSFALNLGNTEFIKPGTTEANMPEMKTVAVKVNSADNGYDIISGTDGKLTTPLEKDDTIIVAIQANNFDQFVQNSFGVQELSVALVYDTRYLEPTSTTNKKYITASKNFLAKDETNFMNQEIDGMYMVDTSTAKYAQDLASGETSILDSNTSNLKKAVLYVTCTPNSATDVNEQLGVITAGQLINFVEFKVKEVPDAGSKGVAITESSNLCLVMQNTGIFNKTWGGIDGLQEYMKINNSLNLFPAGAAKKTGISVKSGTFKSTQYVGATFDSGVTMQFDYNDGSHEDLGTSDTVTYKYGAAGITAADDAGLTAIPATLTSDVNGKHIYAIVGNYICDLGALTVSDVKTTKVEVVSGAPTTAYDGTAINFKDLVAKITKNNGDAVTDIKFTNYENVSNGLAIYKSNATGDVLEKVTAADKYAHGDNYFVVALKSDTTVKSAPFKVTSNYDDITISASTNNAAKTSYNKDDNFDPTGIVVKAKKASETTGADVAYDNFDSNYKVVIATSETEAKTATAVTASTKITEAMLDGNHKVYVVYTNAGSNTQSVVSVATLGAKKITGGSLTGGKTAYTYGDKFDTTVKFTPTYDDGSTGTAISFADLAAAGITVKIGETLVDANTVITPAMKDKTVDFVYDSSKAPVKSNPITVAKKTIKYSVSNTKITKVYDGNTDAPNSTSLPSITTEALVGTDTCTLTGTFAFTDKNAGTNKDVKLTINESTLSDEIKAKYSFVPDGTTVLAGGVLAAKGEITKKALTLNAGVITGLSTKADPNATADVTKDGSLVLTKDNSNLVDGDNVTVPYTYTFGKDDVKTAGNDKPVKIALGDLTGADKDNYTFDKTQVTTAKGNVTQEAFSDIEISGPTKVTYTYPELTPDFGGLVVNAVYGTGASATKAHVTNYKLLDKDGNEFDKTAKLPYGDTTITVSYTEGSVTKTKTITLTAKKKPIKLSDIIFKPESKSYDGTTTATGTATVKEGVTVVGDTVNISAKWEFDGKDVGTNTIKVSDIKADNENYEIVGEDNLPVSSTTINNSTAVIKPATPENVTAKADKKTNNIVLSGTTADFEYSTDNGATWVKAAAGTTTIENAVRNKEYTILVRTAATASAPASDAATVKATTYKYLVNIYKNGAAAGSEPEYKVYTNDEEINAVKDDTTFGKFNSNVLQYTPSRFRAYFTDSACTTSADVANLPKDSNDNINLYYTAKKSSGGGGGSSVSIKLDKDTVSGVVGDKIKVTATVKGSTAKPTWTSSNEDVATVDENGNITLVGKGTATVKVKVNGIVKNIPVTVKEATATPVPTVKPTEAPVINTEYTKPYASGYDDGSFLPNNNITRGELAAMIARLSYGDDLPDGMYQASFPDVDSDAWFNKYIGYLEDKDVLSGYEDGTFRPMDTITRGEISAVIARAQRYDLISYNNIFTDVTENDWAKDYIETLADKNIVSGYEDGTFGPYSPLTRAEAVAIINRVLVESTPIVTFTPNDIAGHWAEADILLAVNERKVGANAVVPTVKPEETAAPEETVAPETTVTPEATVAPEKTTAPEATPAA